MTIVNGNKIQQCKLNKEKEGQASISIIDDQYNTLWVNIKAEHLTKLGIKTFEELEGKFLKAQTFKNGTFLTINEDKPFSISAAGEEYAKIIEIIDNVIVLKIETGKPDLKTKEVFKTIIVKTEKNAIMKIKNKNHKLDNQLDQLVGKKIFLNDISIFKSKEGQVYYSLKEAGEIKLAANQAPAQTK